MLSQFYQFVFNHSGFQRHRHNRDELDITRRGGIPRGELHQYQHNTSDTRNPIVIGRLVPDALVLNEQFHIVMGDVFGVRRDGGEVRNNVRQQEELPIAQRYEGPIVQGNLIILVQGYPC
ncbi:MAG: hypothetical protein CMP21_04310 [Rickettsiales bacterium]|nr:hypothetical protein [Rickettsiales bacterium]|tara:strand:- start:287 stop:646 length:360 start_codon:yes stop_codon:yes gene_type:complete